MTTRTIVLSLLAALSSGCVAEHQLPGGTPGSDGCTVQELVAGNTAYTPTPPGGVTYYGSWVHLSHPADVAASLHVEATGAPPPGGPTEYGGGYLQPGASPEPDGHSALEGLSFNYPGPETSLPLYAPETDIFLFPTGWSYRVRVCREVGDPFPTCAASSGPPCSTIGGIINSGTSGTDCACLPNCATSADCPLPASGDVTPVCSPVYLCILPCDATSTCPTGQTCVSGDHEPLTAGSICMKPV